ncbi:hypothetical protein [Rufibacter roseus]|uniref:Uncharacterized protein n=1 Tax=Rufibacter roseus TaxID=1567108 RepID=A0ABW2DJE2_9BACT|nr:hypothetical protein [Rufibacter roseus]
MYLNPGLCTFRYPRGGNNTYAETGNNLPIQVPVEVTLSDVIFRLQSR